MAKSMFSAAAAVLALSGVASAFPQASGFNATTSGLLAGAAAASGVAASGVALSTGSYSTPTASSNATSSTSSSASASATSGTIKYCPNLDGEIIVGPLDIKYEISCDTNHLGLIIDITLQKRATPTSLTDCLTECSALDQCKAAAFNTEDPTCFLFSTVGAAITADGFQFAEKVSALTTTTSSSASAVATSTGNSTTSGTTSGNSTTVSPLENLFCPQLDAQVYSDGNGDEYIIQCSDNHVGVVIGVEHAKRQTAATTSILDCMALCDANTACVGTGFNTVALTCTLFSNVGAEYYDANVDFALKIATGAAAATTTTVATGAGTGADIVTATVYTTTLSTILSCAATVTDCPLRGSVVTDTVVAYTTVCPASDLAGAITATGTAATGTVATAAAVIACTDCPYAAVSATIYTTTVSTVYACPTTVTNCPLTSGAAAAASSSASSAASVTGAGSAVAAASGASAAASVASAAGASAVSTVTSMVAIATSLVNYPLPASTVVTAASGASGATYAGPSATSTGLVAYTGAASALSAGMGMAGAIVAGAAFLL